jgi:hypothetical protein
MGMNHLPGTLSMNHLAKQSPEFWLIIIPIVIAMLWFHMARSRSLLRQWADGNGYRIVKSSYRTAWRGPFAWTSSKGQTVYRVIVQDPAGNHRTGWVRCGGYLVGLLSDQVEARWDDER